MHQHYNNDLVKAALKDVSDRLGLKYGLVKRLFVSGNLPITHEFWRSFYAANPYRTKGVNYCHTCKKFLLEFYEPRISWALDKDLSLAVNDGSQTLH